MDFAQKRAGYWDVQRFPKTELASQLSSEFSIFEFLEQKPSGHYFSQIVLEKYFPNFSHLKYYIINSPYLYNILMFYIKMITFYLNNFVENSICHIKV